ELILDARAGIELAYQDGEDSLAEVECALIDPAGFSELGGHSDERGRVSLHGLGEGSYRVLATRSDCWPVDLTVPARLQPQLQHVEMRRLGDLDLALVAAGGLPVSGVLVELTASEFGVSVAQWIAEKNVRSSGLVADLQGRIRVDGLPHGPYAWRIALPDG